MTAHPVLGTFTYTQYQADGADTINDHINHAAAAPWPVVQSKSTTTPPGSPTDGQCYVIPSGATGVWLGRTNQLAMAYDSGKWHFRAMATGAVITCKSDDKYYILTSGGTWVEIASF